MVLRILERLLRSQKAKKVENSPRFDIRKAQLSRTNEDILDELYLLKSELYTKKEECRLVIEQRDEYRSMLEELIEKAKIANVVINWKSILGDNFKSSDED